MRFIPNSYLTLSDIPSPEADIDSIGLFALTFAGQEQWGSVEECARVTDSRGQSTLTDLRTWLYFEQRRWHQLEEAPDEEAEGYWRSLVEKIRARVRADDLSAVGDRHESLYV